MINDKISLSNKQKGFSTVPSELMLVPFLMSMLLVWCANNSPDFRIDQFIDESPLPPSAWALGCPGLLITDKIDPFLSHFASRGHFIP